MTRWREAGDWGAQGGLLSQRECETLFGLVCLAKPDLVLEVGHYCGLSTHVIADALRTLGDGHLTTIDSYEPDKWVAESGKERFQKNAAAGLFHEVGVLEVRSQDYDPGNYDFVFYDGDHGDEQLAFTRKVVLGRHCRVMVFDDADFPVPEQCCKYLAESGWYQLPLHPHRGPYDKQSPETMTLAAFVRQR